jgi:hypothetical protein
MREFSTYRGIAVRKVLLLLGACVLVTACSSPEEQFLSAAKDMAKAKLRDPESARFPVEPYLVRTKGKGDDAKFDAIAACGIIDGKNGFGGYTGGSRYVASTMITSGDPVEGAPYSVEIDDLSDVAKYATRESSFDSIYWNKYCVDADHPPMKTGGFN